MSEKIDSRLIELEIQLPEAAAPVGNYVPFMVNGNTVYVSGHRPVASPSSLRNRGALLSEFQPSGRPKVLRVERSSS